MTTELTNPRTGTLAGYFTPDQLTTFGVLDEVFEERLRQDAKFGVQDRPWSPPHNTTPPFFWLCGIDTANKVKAFVEAEAERGTLCYSEILYEEVAEALEEVDPVRAREELIQVAAVAVAAIEAIDRNGR